MYDLDKYTCVSFCESSNGVGIKILVQIPEGRVISELISNEIQNVGYNLYQTVKGQLHRSHPDEIEAIKEERKSIVNLFGDQTIFVEETVNSYDQQYGRPWFIVTTKIGRIDRKSV